MQIRHILSTGLAAAAPLLAAADSTSGAHNFNCGSGTPPPKIIAGLNNLRTAEGATLSAPATSRRSDESLSYASSLSIPIHLHAVTKVGSPMDPAVLHAQYLVIQDAYAQYGIHFVLEGMTRYEDDELSFFNSTRFYGAGDNDDRMWYIGHTRKGGYDTLNIWFYDDMEDGMNGVCTFPHDDDPESSLWRDGCHVLAGTMPGGDREFYNVGYTAVHEAGHWLGLLHPWGEEVGTCGGEDDLVDDTPAQSEPAFNCPVNPDSCPDHPGYDNAWNFMDYADDTCDGEQFFTHGQMIRMHNSYNTYRVGK